MSGYPRLAETIEDYLAMRRARFSPATVKQEVFVLRRFAAWLGDIQVRHIRAERIDEWFVSLLREHQTRDGLVRPAIEANTYNFYRHRLRAFFRYCRDHGLVRDDPMRLVTPMRVDKKNRQQPAPHQLLAMLENTDNARDRCFIATAINTGLRQAEITRLRVGDVQLADRSLSVSISKTGDHDLVPISADLDPELRRWLTQYGEDLGHALAEDDYLFPAATGPRYRWRTEPDGERVRYQVPSTWNPDRAVLKTAAIVKRAMARLGLPTKREGTHTIRRAVARHFFDSMASEQGYDAALRTTSALLHHQSSQTTELYLGLNSERARRDRLLRGQPFLSAMVETKNVRLLGRAGGPSA